MSDVKVWVLGGVLTVVVPALAFLLVREFTRKDRIEAQVTDLAVEMNEAMKEFNQAVNGLTVALQEMKLWSHEHFITRAEFKTTLDGLGAAIADAIDRFERDIERCQDRCTLGKTPGCGGGMNGFH